jgi:hypothetical protein
MIAIRHLCSQFIAGLGRCYFCMRRAFLCALASLACSVIACCFDSGLFVQATTIAIAIVLTSLWIAHLAAYTARNVRLTSLRPQPILSPQRRSAIRLFAGILAASALGSASILFSRAASASSSSACGGDAAHDCDCGDRYVCDNSGSCSCQGDQFCADTNC